MNKLFLASIIALSFSVSAMADEGVANDPMTPPAEGVHAEAPAAKMKKEHGKVKHKAKKVKEEVTH
jgi:hypothetical protein